VTNCTQILLCLLHTSCCEKVRQSLATICLLQLSTVFLSANNGEVIHVETVKLPCSQHFHYFVVNPPHSFLANRALAVWDCSNLRQCTDLAKTFQTFFLVSITLTSITIMWAATFPNIITPDSKSEVDRQL